MTSRHDKVDRPMKLKITDVRAVVGDSGFLLDDGKTAILCDSGFGFTGEAVAENIRKALGDRKLDCILLTHSHYDHVLGSTHIKARFPEAKIVAGVHAQAVFAKEKARRIMGELDRKAALAHGVTEYVDKSAYLAVDLVVEDGDRVQCGDLCFTVIGLPGHTRCSVGYYLEQENLLLAAESLGVYFGQDTYLPSFLVGYGMTLESIEKAKALAPERILLPHYGPAEGAAAAAYLHRGEQAAKAFARSILDRLRQGMPKTEVLEAVKAEVYLPHVRPALPVDAFYLNTGIMIDLVEKELL